MSARSADHLEDGSDALQVLQLTDTHLYADEEGRLLGQRTRQTLDLVLDLVPRALAPLDLVLLTGDLVHDESPEGYQYLKERMAALDAPCHCLPGNHDNSSIMADIFESGPAKMGTSVRQGRWSLILLDSTVPGKDGGHLDREQLGHLQDSLASRPDDPALVCLHHQPVPVGSNWMDTMALDNPDEFFGIIDRHPQVRAVLWGHVHQEFSSERKGVRLLGSPSTCVQFLPGSRDFTLDTRTPGLRWLKLYGDGRIDTGVERIASYPDPLVLTKSGY
jgi:3',5'-cyclic-AMP phosphodiesterase